MHARGAGGKQDDVELYLLSDAKITLWFRMAVKDRRGLNDFHFFHVILGR